MKLKKSTSFTCVYLSIAFWLVFLNQQSIASPVHTYLKDGKTSARSDISYIEGPNPACAGQVEYYYLVTSLSDCASYTWIILSGSGTIVEDGGTYVGVVWEDASGGTLAVNLEGCYWDGQPYLSDWAFFHASSAWPPNVSITASATTVCRGQSVQLMASGGGGYSWSGGGISSGAQNITVTPASTTTYILTSYVGSAGCADSESITITVQDPLPAPIVSGAGREGAGEITMTVSNYVQGATYRWYASTSTGAMGALLHTGPSYTTQLPQDTYFYLSAQLNACTTAAQQFEAKVYYGLGEQGLNYVAATQVIQKGITDPLQIKNLPPEQVRRSVTYGDGLGRSIQTVAQQASPTQQDVVQMAVFDEFGQQTKTYLPFTLGTDGRFKPHAVQQQAAFYAPTNSANPDLAKDTKPYAETVLENSPLRRVESQKVPGQVWDTHATTMASFTNAANEVRRWTEIGDGNQFYAAGELYGQKVVNGQGNESRTFTDKLGRTVLKQQQLGEMLDGQSVTRLETYYVYNEIGSLKYQVPPQAVVELRKLNSWVLTPDFINKWVFAYTYDTQGRLATKKVPGAGPVALVYDPADRVVLAQDANQETQNKWLYTQYDELGRVVAQGFYNPGQKFSQSQMQQQVDNYLTTNGSLGTGKFFMDNEAACEVLAVNYYDSYAFDVAQTTAFAFDNTGLPNVQRTERVRGLPTGREVRVLGTNQWLPQVMYYDQEGRAVQTVTGNLLNGIDRRTVEFDFEGKTVATLSQHSGAGGPVTVRNTYAYDHMGRVKEVRQRNNSDPEVVVAQYNYNALGQLTEKNLHKKVEEADHFLQSVDLRYDVQGRLLSMNGSALDNTRGNENDGMADLFGMELLYEQADTGLGNTARWDGLVTGVKWKTKDPHLDSSKQPVAQRERGYKLSYDKIGRMNHAYYTARENAGGAWGIEAGGYDEKNLTYDANGNIKRLLRTTTAPDGTVPIMDNLVYAYDGNQLQEVQDVGDKTTGFKDSSPTISAIINMISSTPVTTCGARFYDSGGNASSSPFDPTRGNYRNYENLTKTFTPATSGSKLTMHFSTFDTEFNDILYVYDGANSSAPLIGMYYGYLGSFTVTATNPTGQLTIRFTSDGSGTRRGWDATVSCSEYRYDANGNQLLDQNKGLTYSYNALNKVAEAKATNGTDKATYVYDAAGNMLQRTVMVGTTTTVTTYANGFVYENRNHTGHTLAYFPTVEGRMVMRGGRLFYEYALKDHQGNVRLTFSPGEQLNEEVTMEPSAAPQEEEKFSNVSQTRHLDTRHAYSGQASARLNARQGRPIGPRKWFSAQAGDSVYAQVQAHYVREVRPQGFLFSLLGFLLGKATVEVSSGPGDGTAKPGKPKIIPYLGLGTGLALAPAVVHQQQKGVPKAYLRVLVYDQDSTFVKSFEQPLTQAAKGSWQELAIGYKMEEAGHLEVLVVNEQDEDVYFDALRVGSLTPLVTQEVHYYPFGQRLAGLATSSPEDPVNPNRLLYNQGSELEEFTNTYSTYFRHYDPLLGRFQGVDPNRLTTTPG